VRIAVISDIHGNLPALEAVLADIAAERVDRIVNLGDIVSGPLWAAETADRLMAMNLPTIAGNHERQVLAPSLERMGTSDRLAAQALRSEHRDWLRALPPTLQLDREVFCCHGTPDDDLRYFLETTTATSEAAPSGVRAATVAEAAQRAGGSSLGVEHAVILCGHTHVPRALQLPDGRLIVNPGSVGLQAYDDDHPLPHRIEMRSPHARYAVLQRTGHGWNVSLRAVAYDCEAAARRAEEAGSTDWAAALRTGLCQELSAPQRSPSPPRRPSSRS
jgi:predicted phosphodiesterase